MRADYVELCNKSWRIMVMVGCLHCGPLKHQHYICKKTDQPCEKDTCPKLKDINERWAEQGKGEIPDQVRDDKKEDRQ
jgi:hypothetical protein